VNKKTIAGLVKKDNNAHRFLLLDTTHPRGFPFFARVVNEKGVPFYSLWVEGWVLTFPPLHFLKEEKKKHQNFFFVVGQIITSKNTPLRIRNNIINNEL
jgi:hypothetical protein